MSSPDPVPAATIPPAKAPRHPVEFWLVRGGILLLLLSVGIQAHARLGYEQSLRKLQNELATDEEEAGGLMVSEVPGFIVGWPRKSIETDRHWKQVTYSWRGLTDSYQIHMAYDDSEDAPYVLGLLTDHPPELAPIEHEVRTPEEQAATATAASAMHGGGGAPSGGGPGGGAGPGGPGGGGPRPDLMASDADGDGKVSREEAPERMAQFFDRMDANSDGFIDAEEVAEARRRRQANGGGGGPGGPGGPRERPAAEESAPTSAPTEPPADALQPEGQ